MEPQARWLARTAVAGRPSGPAQVLSGPSVAEPAWAAECPALAPPRRRPQGRTAIPQSTPGEFPPCCTPPLYAFGLGRPARRLPPDALAPACGQITTARWLSPARPRQRAAGNGADSVYPSLIALLGFAAHQDFALARMVGLADHALVLHPLHERSGPIIADLQPPLDVAGRGLAVAQHDLHGLLIKVGRVADPHAGRVEHRAVLVLLVAAGGDGFEILRGALRLEVTDDLLDLLVGDERP